MHIKSNIQLGLSQTERLVIDTLTRLGITTIKSPDLEREFGYTKPKSNLFLSRLAKKGWLQKLGPGIYRIIPMGSDSANPIPEDPWAIAMKIFSPCYISGFTAAEHWDLTEQVFNTTIVFTKKKQRNKNHKIAGLNFRTKFIAESRYFGTTKIWSDNKPIQIADIHKTIIDILEDPEMGGGGRHTIDIFKAYLQKKEANIEILLKYAETLNYGSVYKRLGFLIERIDHDKVQIADKLQSKINSGIINLDPGGPSEGPIITKWGIKVNVPVEDFS